jgi:hypothetical protein
MQIPVTLFCPLPRSSQAGVKLANAKLGKNSRLRKDSAQATLPTGYGALLAGNNPRWVVRDNET